MRQINYARGRPVLKSTMFEGPRHMQTPTDGLVVLVVDDDVAVLNSIKFSLEVEGYEVVASLDGLDLFEGGATPAVTGCLVIDYELPRGNGLDLLNRLRERGVAWPAILITTDPDESVRRRAAKAGVPIVEKPLLGNALVEAIGAAFAT